jgi:hypothetical protein
MGDKSKGKEKNAKKPKQHDIKEARRLKKEKSS